jgi:flagellar biosynthesis chaperone FliJ
MAEEKVSTEFYFYKDIDNAFFKVIQTINQDKTKRENVFANVMYVNKPDGKKDVVVYVSKSDDVDEEYKLIYPENPVERMKLVERNGLKKVYTLKGNPDVEFDKIFYRQVYDGKILIEPLNIAYNNSRTISNFLNLSSYKNCDDIECIRQKPKCDNKSFFVDNAIKFSKEIDKPHTNMFCRQYGVIEISEELNEIDNYNQFIARLENEYKNNFIIASDIENNLRNFGSDNSKNFLTKYRYKDIQLSEDDRNIAIEISNSSNSYVEFSSKLKRLIFSTDPNLRTSGNNVKNYLKYMGDVRIKDFVNQLNTEIDQIYMQEKDKMTQLSRKEPSLLEMTFNIGQKVSEQMTEVIRSGRRTIRDIKRRVSPYSEGLMRRGESMLKNIRSGIESMQRSQRGKREDENI